MENRQLKYFLEICRERSFSSAAKSLYISQQALSKSIQKLESDLGVPLFERTNSGIRLTQYGEYLEKRAAPILDELECVCSDIAQMKESQQGKVEAAFSFGVISSFPPDWLLNFQRNYPNILISIKEYPDTLCEQAVYSEQADVGFTIAPVEESRFCSRVLKRDKMCLLINEKNPLSQKKSVCFEELRNERFILVNQEFKLHHNFIYRCRKAGFEPQIYCSTMEMMLVQKLSRANQGIGVSVSFICDNLPGTRAVLFSDPTCTWEVCLITKPNRKASYAVQTFLNYICSLCNTHVIDQTG